MKKTMMFGALISAMTALCSQTAQAADLSYDYVGLSYISSSVDDTVFDPSGIQIGFSKLLGESVYFKAAGSYTTASDDGIKNKLTETQLGLGYRIGIFNSVDVYGEAGWVSATSKLEGDEVFFEGGSTKLSDSGYMVEAGTRLAFTHYFNSDVFVRQTGYSDFGDRTDYGVILRFSYKSVELFSEFTSSSKRNDWGVGLQYNF
jgi:hypothetical protein